MLVTEMIDRINVLQNKFNYTDNQMAKGLGSTTKKRREFRLNHEVFYREDEVKNNNYLELAI